MKKADALWLLALPVYLVIGTARHELSHALVAAMQGARIFEIQVLPSIRPEGGFAFGCVNHSDVHLQWVVDAAPYLCDVLFFVIFFAICRLATRTPRWLWINCFIIGLLSPGINTAYNYSKLFWASRGDVNDLVSVFPSVLIHAVFLPALAVFAAGIWFVLRARRQSDRQKARAPKSQVETLSLRSRAACVFRVALVLVLFWLLALGITDYLRRIVVAKVHRPSVLYAHDSLARALEEGTEDRSDDTNGSRPVDGELVPTYDPAGVSEWIELAALAERHLYEGGHRRVYVFEEMTTDFRDPDAEGELSPTDLARVFDEHDELVRESRRISQLAAAYPFVVLQPAHFTYRGDETEMAVAWRLMHCGRFMAARSIHATRGGEYEEAKADLLAAMRIGDALLETPLWPLIGYGCYDGAFAALAELLAAPDSEISLVTDIEDHLAAAHHREAFADYIACVAWSGFDSWRQCVSEGALSYPRFSLWPRGGVRAYNSLLCRPLRNLDERRYTQDLLVLLALAQEPHHYDCSARLNAIRYNARDIPCVYRVSETAVSPTSYAFVLQAKHETRVDLARAAIQIERYRRERGAYPNRLEDIAAQPCQDPPLDAFTGSPFMYEVWEDSYVLYSVGWDLEDDGGPRGANLPKYMQDIVWDTPACRRIEEMARSQAR